MTDSPTTPRRVFVAGATGVVGLPAVRALLADGHRVTGVARTPAKADQLRALGAEAVAVDLFDTTAVKAATEGHDVVVNLATRIPPSSQAWRSGAWAENERLRTEASALLADAALDHGAERFVQEALAFAYADHGDDWIDEDEPIEPPGELSGVLTAETSARRVTDAGAVGIVLRFGNFYGPTAGHTREQAQLVRRRVSPTPGEPEAWWSLVHTDDAGAAVAAALRAPAGAYNVVDDRPVRRRELDDAMARALGVGRLRRPPKVVRRAVESKAPILTRSIRASNARLRAATGWAPAYPSVEEGWAAVAGALNA